MVGSGCGGVLIVEPVIAGGGAIDEGRAHPAVDEATAGLAVSLAVIRREWDKVGGTEALAVIGIMRFRLPYR